MFLTLTVLWASCIKQTDQPQPQPTEPHIPDTILTTEKLIGKWEIIHLTYIWAMGVDATLSEWIKDDGFYDNGNLDERWNPESHVSYINFNQDKTYSHYKPDGSPDSYMFSWLVAANGTWELRDGKQLRLPTSDLDTTKIDTYWNAALKDSVLTIYVEFWNPVLDDSSLTQWTALLKKVK